MNYLTQARTADSWFPPEQYTCPYHSVVSSICSASLSMMMIGLSTRKGYCETENYDDCPLFLSKMLRKRG
jgi:hypothetical protein